MHVLTILGSSESSSGSGIASIGIFLLIPVAMYFLLIRPQRRRMKEQAALQAAIGIGDEVMTTSGIYGFITGFDGDIVWLEIDDNIQIRVSRAAVQRKVDTTGGEGPVDTSDRGTDLSALDAGDVADAPADSDIN
jgi:preprotein translocase subunit YajC